MIAHTLKRWKKAAIRRFWSIPSWGIVVATAAVIGAVSASVSVMALAKYQNRDASPPAVDVEVTDVQTVEQEKGT